MNNPAKTGKLERRPNLADYASVLKGQTAIDAAKAIEQCICQHFGVFMEEHVSGIVQSAINKETADLKAQLAERDELIRVLNTAKIELMARCDKYDAQLVAAKRTIEDYESFMCGVARNIQAAIKPIATLAELKDKGV